MAKVSIIVTASGHMTIVTRGHSYPIPPDHPNYKRIKQAVKADDDEAVVNLANIPRSITISSGGAVTVSNGNVYYNGVPQHSELARRILQLMNEDLPFQPMVRFLENLELNPSFRSRKELYVFLENHALPITEDGCFLGYKRVDQDWFDFNSRTIDNHIGQKPFMARREVDDDYHMACSNGFHIGAISYVATFELGKPGHIIIVKVNPKDVVTVPEGATDKLRCYTYEVLQEYVGDLNQSSVYTSAGEPCISAPTEPDYEDEEEEEEEYEEEEEEEEHDDE